jgi:glycosyltransferase involved in cell wall biosynthesis
MVTLPFDEYVAISHATRCDLLEEGVSAANVRVIYPGVDDIFAQNGGTRRGELRNSCHIARDDFLYLYYGRPGVTKGVEFLVQAVPEVQRQVPNAHLVLILADEPRDNYLRVRRLVNDLQPSCNVHLLPRVPPDGREQLVRHLLDADCIVVPSLTEGFGFTTAEASALGIPVVATCVGSIPEVVSGAHVLVKAGSSSALARGVVRACLGQYDHSPRKEFTWARMVDGYESLYQELMRSCM